VGLDELAHTLGWQGREGFNAGEDEPAEA